MAVNKKGSSQPKATRRRSLETILPWLYVIGGAIATVASTALSIEVFDRLKNPDFVPVCNLNPILSCTSVADSQQAHAFGFPNYFIGIAGYAAVMAIGLALLAGAHVARWFWRIVAAGLLFAVGFVTWLQFETVYRIGALCIFCMIVWVCTIPMFWYTWLYCFQKNYIPTGRFQRIVWFARRHHLDILIVWFLIIIALILKRFWYYWQTLV